MCNNVNLIFIRFLLLGYCFEECRWFKVVDFLEEKRNRDYSVLDYKL